MVMFDEASQCADPDLIMATGKFYASVKLLVLAGDTKQLDPVVVSQLRKQNPLGNMLATPP